MGIFNKLKASTTDIQVAPNIDFTAAMESAEKDFGKVNILISGLSGIGKSTLINACFGKDVAPTGTGNPQTQTISEYCSPNNDNYSIFDTKGIELKDYKSTVSDVEKFIKEKNKEVDINKRLHIGWYCILDDGSRVQDSDRDMINMIAKYMPVIVVVTKYRGGDKSEEFVNFIRNEFGNTINNVIGVRAEGEVHKKGEAGYNMDVTILPYNLEELINITEKLIPDAQAQALSSAQKVSVAKKVERAHLVLSLACTAASTTGALPGSSAYLTAEQATMLASISKVFGLNLNKGFLTSLVVGMFGPTAASAGGMILFNFLRESLSVVPIAGNLIKAGVAGSITWLLGEAYIQTLKICFTITKGEVPTPELIATEFKKAMSPSNLKKMMKNKEKEEKK